MNRLSIPLACLLVLTGCGAQDVPIPLPDAADRPIPLHFGLFVTPDPAVNPIDPPERFTGYHAATDFETFEKEQDIEVPVSAICDGNVLYSSTANGYGGVLIHTCILEGSPVTVLYGHIDPKSITKNEGDLIKYGEKIGILGDHKSAETGHTRKHLHLGIHKGETLELRGYVQDESELADFIDPMSVLQF